MKNSQTSHHDAAGCLVRLFWMLVGNAALFMLGVYIYERHAHSFSLFDGLYGLILALIILSRFIDIRFLHGDTADGKPASMAHFRKHIMVILPLFIVLLMLAHVLGILFS